jgi:hypothetical protein
VSAPKLHRTRWTREEDAFLEAEWDGTRDTAAVIAELLGRTVNATAQRHYELTWGTAVDPVEVKPEPSAPRPGRERLSVRVTVIEVELRPTDRVCPECWLVLPASGTCDHT